MLRMHDAMSCAMCVYDTVNLYVWKTSNRHHDRHRVSCVAPDTPSGKRIRFSQLSYIRFSMGTGATVHIAWGLNSCASGAGGVGTSGAVGPSVRKHGVYANCQCTQTLARARREAKPKANTSDISHESTQHT
jgi:hypothetical protein